MLQVVTRDGNVRTFPDEYIWYKDREQNALVIYRDIQDDDSIWVFGLNEITYFYAGVKEVLLNGN